MTAVTRYRAAPFEQVRGRQGNRILLRPGGERGIVPDGLFAILDPLREFRTLAEHATGRDAVVRGALDTLKREGFLVSEEEFFAAALRPDALPVAAPPRIVGIPTRADTPVLRRAMSSFESAAEKFGHKLRFVIAGAGGENNTAVRWIDAEAKQALAKSLTGADPSVVHFALFGEAPGLPSGLARNTGANRNALSLACAGEPFLSVDDDVICSLVSHPQAARSLALQSGSTARDVWFAPHPSSSPADREIDLFGAVGRAFGPAIRERLPLAASDLDHGSFGRLMSGNAHSPVVVPGLFGDSATNSPAGWLTASGATRERLVATEAGYREALSSRRVFHAAPCETLVDYSSLMSYCVGLDNREFLPPFPPLGRDQDGIFAHWLHLSDPHAFIRDLPFAVTHEPAEIRSFDSDWISRPISGLILNDVIRLLLDRVPAHSAGHTPERRLTWLGNRLTDTASLPSAEFADYLASKRLQMLSRGIRYCEKALTAFGSRPAWWARDLQAHIRGYEQAMTDPPMLRLAEPGGQSLDPAAALDVIRTYLHWCGRLLLEWPAMRSAAQAVALSASASGV